MQGTLLTVPGSRFGCCWRAGVCCENKNGFVEGRRSRGGARGVGDSWRVVATLLISRMGLLAPCGRQCVESEETYWVRNKPSPDPTGGASYVNFFRRKHYQESCEARCVFRLCSRSARYTEYDIGSAVELSAKLLA
jgi:hypothetical protein